jgi:hypothetical protein
MRKSVFPFIVTIIALLSGLFLQTFSYLWLENDALVNVVWGSVYGAGWGVAIEIFGSENIAGFVLGYFIWPALVTCCIFLVSKSIIKRSSKGVNAVTLSLFLLSLLIIIPSERLVEPPLSSLPHFYRLLAEDS